MATPTPFETELRELMIRYQHADGAAVEQLVNRLSPVLLRFLLGPEIAREEAEDILQDCWLRIHRSRASYCASEPVLPWIFAIARHTRVDAYRKRRRVRKRELLVENIAENAGAAFQPELEDGNFLRFLRDLPDSQREVITMLKVSGMTIEEVARATSSTIGAVKQKAHRAYAKLRLSLENTHGYVSHESK